MRESTVVYEEATLHHNQLSGFLLAIRNHFKSLKEYNVNWKPGKELTAFTFKSYLLSDIYIITKYSTHWQVYYRS